MSIKFKVKTRSSSINFSIKTYQTVTNHIGMELSTGSKNVSRKIFVLTIRFLYRHDFHKFLKTFSDIRENYHHFIIFNNIPK